jgi:hypothetical protein
VASLAFLLAAGVLILIGSLVLWLRERKPSSEFGVEEFAREMRALAPDRGAPADGPRRRRSARPGGQPPPEG